MGKYFLQLTAGPRHISIGSKSDDLDSDTLAGLYVNDVLLSYGRFCGTSL